MKIKMLVSIAGVDFSAKPGDELEVSTEQGKRMISAGHAVAIKAVKVEKAVTVEK